MRYLLALWLIYFMLIMCVLLILELSDKAQEARFMGKGK